MNLDALSDQLDGLYGLASKLVKLLLFLFPLIFLFYLNGANFYIFLGVFLIMLVFLWLGYWINQSN
jgi:fatty-acid desaturase